MKLERSLLDIIGIPIRFYPAIRIHQDAALRENSRRIFCQQHDAGGGGVMFPCLRVMPDQAAHRSARKEVGGDQSADHFVIEAGPPQPRQRL